MNGSANISITPLAVSQQAEHILTHPREWGVQTPEQCQEIAERLVYLRWLVRTDRLRGDTERWLP